MCLTTRHGTFASSREQELLAGVDHIAVTWSNATAQLGSSVTVKLCYDKSLGLIVDRPWRKFKDEVKKNKQCQQTADAAKQLAKGLELSPAEYKFKIPMNTATSTYYVQVLLTTPGQADAYEQWGDSQTSSCEFKVKSYDNMPTNMKGTFAFFTVASFVVCVVAYLYDKSKQP